MDEILRETDDEQSGDAEETSDASTASSAPGDGETDAETFAVQMAAAERVMQEDRDALRELAN